MKERITALISFIASVVGLVSTIYILYRESTTDYAYYSGYHEELLGLFLLMFPFLSTILYIIWTKFGKKGLSELEQFEYENQILRKKIEHQELLKKLE